MTKGLQAARTAPTSTRMATLLALSGRRWSLRVLWELRRGPLNFRALREAGGGISPGVLQSRLNEWRDLAVIETIPGLGYRLTARGEQLFQTLAPLVKWAEAAQELDRESSDKKH
ncbi:MAG: helix-turn-helix domain-containing protein [Woeseia sp.]